MLDFLKNLFYSLPQLLEFKKFYDCKGHELNNGDQVTIDYIGKGTIETVGLCYLLVKSDGELIRLRYIINHSRIEKIQ